MACTQFWVACSLQRIYLYLQFQCGVVKEENGVKDDANVFEQMNGILVIFAQMGNDEAWESLRE